MGPSDIARLNEVYGSSYKNAQDVIDSAVIIHYASGEKPWKYTFKPWAKEWYKYYMMSPYKNVEFKLRGIWSYRFDKYTKILREQGIKGVIASRKEKNKKSSKWE